MLARLSRRWSPRRKLVRAKADRLFDATVHIRAVRLVDARFAHGARPSKAEDRPAAPGYACGAVLILGMRLFFAPFSSAALTNPRRTRPRFRPEPTPFPSEGPRQFSACVLELRGRFRAPGRIAGGVGVGARAGELAAVDDEIFLPDRSALEPAFENLARARRVARLRRERGAGNVGRHAVVRHGAPRMVLRRRLRETHVSRVSGKLAAFERANNGV